MTLQAHFKTQCAYPLLAKIYNMLPIFSDLSPRKAVIKAVLPICHSVHTELETFLCSDCGLINKLSAVHACSACHPIYLVCIWLLAVLHNASLIFHFRVLKLHFVKPYIHITLTTAVAQSKKSQGSVADLISSLYLTRISPLAQLAISNQILFVYHFSYKKCSPKCFTC